MSWLYLAFEPTEQQTYLDLLLSSGLQAEDIQRTPDHNTKVTFGSPRKIAETLKEMPNLAWAHSSWAGVEPLLQQPRDNFELTNTRDVFGPLIAEFVFGYLLLFEKNILAKYENQQLGKWDGQLPGTLRGKTIGIAGVGSIGSHVAMVAKSFGMITRGLTRNSTDCRFIDRFYTSANPVGFGTGLDYLVGVLPNTTYTRDLINGAMLAALNTGAIVINVGRGATLDERALEIELRNDHLRGAVLDVLKTEPLPTQDPLWQVPNLFITSHTSAPSFPAQVIHPFLKNLHLFKQGQPLLYKVSFKQQY